MLRDVAVGDSLSLSQVTRVCDGRVWLLGGCRGLWAAADVCGGRGYVGRRGGRWLLRWWLWDEEGSRVTVCDACDFWITNVRTLTNALVPKFALSIPYTIL